MAAAQNHANGNETNQNINALFNKEFTYEKIKEIADWLLERVEIRPKIAIVCGSGLGQLGERLTDVKIFPYHTVPNFPTSTVQGHKGNLIFGKLNDVEVCCMQGRFHAYEGYSSALCTLPIKVFKLLGVDKIILTCAAGSVNRTYKVGDIMVIKDHISMPLLALQHPLVGHNDERFGPRFTPANRLYSKKFREIFVNVAKELNIDIREGVYMATGGPSYETPSDIRAFQILGADAVGMSTAQESIVAGYCGIHVFALALITNVTVVDYDSDDMPNHAEVIQVANRRAKDIEDLVFNFVDKI